jgi:hypothetical protein
MAALSNSPVTVSWRQYKSDSQLAGTLPAGPGRGWPSGYECGGSNSTPAILARVSDIRLARVETPVALSRLRSCAPTGFRTAVRELLRQLLFASLVDYVLGKAAGPYSPPGVPDSSTAQKFQVGLLSFSIQTSQIRITTPAI